MPDDLLTTCKSINHPAFFIFFESALVATSFLAYGLRLGCQAETISKSLA
jgi:hypothetical protein